jgi:hypothetical protein
MYGTVNQNRSPVSRRAAARLISLLLLGGTSAAHCQESAPPDGNSSVLRKFEKSVQPHPYKPVQPAPVPAPAPYRTHNRNESLGNTLANELINTGMDVVAELGKITMQRLSPDTDATLRRNDGDLLIPFVRYDFAHQIISGNIFANNHRLEAGYGPFAVLYEDYIFHEQAPGNTLTINRQMLVYRMSANKTIEVDFGLGQTILYGSQRTPLDTVTIPVRIIVSEGVALELRPTWANTMDDYELALHWKYQFGSLKIGYRSLISSGEALNGPFAGFSLYY